MKEFKVGREMNMDNFKTDGEFTMIPISLWQQIKCKVDERNEILKQLVKIKNKPISNSLKLRELNKVISVFEGNNPNIK